MTRHNLTQVNAIWRFQQEWPGARYAMVFVSNWLRDWTSTPSRSDSERADIPYPVFGRSVSRQPAVGGVIHKAEAIRGAARVASGGFELETRNSH